MKIKPFLIVIFVVTAVVAYAGDAEPESSGPQPEYLPYCQSPSQIAPVQAAGGGLVWFRSALAWNGREYGMAYIDSTNSSLYFRRFFADGTQAAPAISLGSAQFNYHPSIVWSGSSYALAWVSSPEAYTQIDFALLSSTGSVISGPTRVSFAAGTQESWSSNPTLAASGSGFAVVWSDERNYGSSKNDLFATLLNADGSIAGSGAYHDIVISSAAENQYKSAVVWSPLSQRYVIAYESAQSGSGFMEIFGATLNPATGTGAIIGMLESAGSTAPCGSPSLASGPTGIGLAWHDGRSGHYEIYFQLLDPGGNRSGTALRLTDYSADKGYPRAVWTGAEYGVLWQDQRNGRFDVWFQRVTSSGTLPGGSINNVQVSSISGDIYYPDAAFAKYGYLVAFAPSGYGNLIMPLGCNGISAPGCPTNLIAYGVSGSSATIAWQAALDNYTDIAYYSVYRNDSEIAKTAETYYTDTGLATGATYNYTVRAVNAAQMINDQNYCGDSQSQTVYVKTSSSFTLLLDKSSDPDAHLYWNDGGMNSYNIFRGTSPQVMSLIGTTSGQSADDNNVLLDKNNYFYTVDDPGQ